MSVPETSANVDIVRTPLTAGHVVDIHTSHPSFDAPCRQSAQDGPTDAHVLIRTRNAECQEGKDAPLYDSNGSTVLRFEAHITITLTNLHRGCRRRLES